LAKARAILLGIETSTLALFFEDFFDLSGASAGGGGGGGEVEGAEDTVEGVDGDCEVKESISRKLCSGVLLLLEIDGDDVGTDEF